MVPRVGNRMRVVVTGGTEGRFRCYGIEKEDLVNDQMQGRWARRDSAMLPRFLAWT